MNRRHLLTLKAISHFQNCGPQCPDRIWQCNAFILQRWQLRLERPLFDNSCRWKSKYGNSRPRAGRAFKDGILNSDLITNFKGNATELVEHYDTVLRTLLELMPLWSLRLYIPSLPIRRLILIFWPLKGSLVSSNVFGAKRPTSLRRSRLLKQTHLCNRLMAKAKSAQYAEVIADDSSDYRSWWKAFNKVLHRCPTMHLPDHSSACGRTRRHFSFNKYNNKILIICAAFPSHAHLNTNNPNPPNTWAELHDIVPVLKIEIRRPVSTSPCKSCNLDPIPTTLLKTALTF